MELSPRSSRIPRFAQGQDRRGGISGGELRCCRRISRISAANRPRMGFSVKLDTNGSLPESSRDLAGEGLLDYVAMDIKNPLRGTERPASGLRYEPWRKAHFCFPVRSPSNSAHDGIREFHDEDSFPRHRRMDPGGTSITTCSSSSIPDLGARLHEADIPAMNKI